MKTSLSPIGRCNYHLCSLSIEWKERVNVLLNPGFLLVIPNFCPQNQANVVSRISKNYQSLILALTNMGSLL